MTWIGGAASAAHRRRPPWRSACLAASAVAALAGCIVDDDDKCSANQEFNATRVCVCVADAVPDPRGYGCIKCGEHEQAAGTECQCVPGYARPSAGMPCEETSGSVAGEACSETMPCSDPYPYCATANGESFCTSQGCTANSQCPDGWICDTPGASGFCREPEGIGKSCTSAADCGGEATYCETFVTMTCIVEKCASNPSMCPSGQVCCDAMGFLGTSLCTPSSALMGGLCFDGNAPVSP